MDISATTEPRSDQQNFDDYAGGPKVVTITEVRQGTAEQPVEIHLVEFPGRPYKPSKSMRRVLVAAWGPDSSAYAGRRMRLHGDPAVKFGGVAVGGIKIGALSHIDKPMKLKLTVSKGQRSDHVVEPLPDAPTPPPVNPTALAENIAEATTADEVKKIGNFAHSQGALDVEVDGRPLREHVTERLADFAEQERTEAEGGDPA